MFDLITSRQGLALRGLSTPCHAPKGDRRQARSFPWPLDEEEQGNHRLLPRFEAGAKNLQEVHQEIREDLGLHEARLRPFGGLRE